MVSLDQIKGVDASFRVYSFKEDNRQVSTLCSLENIQENGVVFIKNQKYYHKLLDKLQQGCAVNNIGLIFQDSFLKGIGVADEAELLNRFRFYASVSSVDLAFSYISKLFFDDANSKANDLIDGRKAGTARVHPTSSIADDVFLGENVEIAANVTIYPGCVILSNSKIGENTILYPNVVIYRNNTIGRDCMIHANSTIGSDGFSYSHDQQSHLKIWHFGGVIVEDSVEIGSNTSIDQGTFSPTVIGRGSKIDNQVHIAHNCQLGKGVIICGQSGLAGSVTIGDYVVIGGAVNIAPGLKIGNYANIGGMSGVTGNVPEKGAYAGHPARPLNEWLRALAALRRMALRKNGDHPNIKKCASIDALT